MAIHGLIRLFFKKKYTHRGIHGLFKELNLVNFSLSPIIKSPVYNEIDLRRFEGRLSFTIEGNELVFDLAVEEYDAEEGTNTIQLEFSGSNRATYECVYFSDNFFPIFKGMKDLEGIALVGDDETAPSNNFYAAFKNGDFDIYLQPLETPFSPSFHFDAWKRHFKKRTSMTDEQITTFIQEFKDKWS